MNQGKQLCNQSSVQTDAHQRRQSKENAEPQGGSRPPTLPDLALIGDEVVERVVLLQPGHGLQQLVDPLAILRQWREGARVAG